LPILATRDHHRAEHISFYTSYAGTKPLDVIRTETDEQVLWRTRCIQSTPGAEILLPPDLIDLIIDKRDRKEVDNYSGFWNDGGQETEIKGILEDRGIRHLITYELATDYCVQATVLHAIEEGYSVTLILSLSRGITPNGTRTAVERMKSAGAIIEE
jgi:nicotinamidase/pyrazinamidase